VPVDPLADEYGALLKRYEIEPPVRTIKAHGERLLEQFAPGTFDIAYATNSLDHSYDPLLIVRNMLALVNEAGVVLLRHVLREGVRQQWVGPHQWNFDVDGGDVLIWNHAVRHSLGSALAAQASVEGWVEEGFVLVRLTPFGSAASATGS
jgi:SAM-dependent methyltransferase